MGRLLFGIFLIVPLIEIGIFVLVGRAVGLWLTLGGVVATALVGSFIIRWQGLSLLGEIRQLAAAGSLPARQIADGVMLAIAGALLLTPGYFTDVIGFLALVPAVRTLVYQRLKSRIGVVAGFQSTTRPGPGFKGARKPHGGEAGNPDIVDLGEDNWRDK
ncbi:MAG TPA: FxsA family protein [Devosia sp.]|nr:FxsA family protein [Devosia sp.]